MGQVLHRTQTHTILGPIQMIRADHILRHPNYTTPEYDQDANQSSAADLAHWLSVWIKHN